MSISRELARLRPNSSGQLPTANIQDAAITTAKIADAAVVEADIANLAVTNAKIASLAASKLTGQLPDANAPSGSVIQVVQTVYSSNFSTTSNAYVDVFSVNITPQNTSSRILLLASVIRTGDSWNGGFHFTAFRRGSTELFFQRVNNWAGSQSDTTGNAYNVGLMYVDSPATTSSITYNLSVASGGSSLTTWVNTRAAGDNLGSSSIIAMEIAG